MRMHRLFCFLLFPLSTLGLRSQALDFAKGWVVLESGDTLHGELRYRSRDGLKEKIYIKISDTEKKYIPLMGLRSFRADSLHYRKIDVSKRQVFVKELALGTIELVEEEYLRDYQGQSISAFRLYFRTHVAQPWEEVKTNGNRWREQMGEIMGASPEWAEMVQKKELTPDDLGKIVRQYNAKHN
jgi:hypothetical protein